MFINCPACRGLVATDPATDLPPERCPRCAAPLRGTAADGTPADDARTGVAAAMAEAFGTTAAHEGAPDPADDGAARPAISIAGLLQPVPDAAADPAPEGVAVPIAEHAAPDAEHAVPDEPEAAADAVPVAAPGPVAAAAPSLPSPPSPPAPQAAQAAQAAPAATSRRLAPSFARAPHADAPGAPAGRRWPMPAAIAGLALLLAILWLLADRERLASSPTWRPLVSAACTVLRCSLPPWHEPAAFVLLERDVRPHPDAPGALRITASFRNTAAWPQAWPEVVLTLSDIDGRPLGARAFGPVEYLGDRPPSPFVASGQGGVIRMDVLEPGPGAVGFSFDFR